MMGEQQGTGKVNRPDTPTGLDGPVRAQGGTVSMNRFFLFLGALALVAVAAFPLTWVPDPVPAAVLPDHQAPGVAWADEPLQPLPQIVSEDPERVKIGRRLFHDPRLSKDGKVACSTCHDLRNGGDDGLPVSVGMGGAKGEINSPTVFNAAYNFRLFLDGRAATLEAQIDGPIHDSREMASGWPRIIALLKRDSYYLNAFATEYRDGITAANVKDAIATYERTLITPDSRFDRFLRGDQSALNEEERTGYLAFKRYGCSSCHQGRNVGGNMYQKFGLFNEAELLGDIHPMRHGRSFVTGLPEDIHVFRVPSLRNVALTAPYFHDGSAATMSQAVSEMAEHQIGRKIPDEDVAQIVQFLNTLTGEYQGVPL